MKKVYVKPEVEIIRFEVEDALTSSFGSDSFGPYDMDWI